MLEDPQTKQCYSHNCFEHESKERSIFRSVYLRFQNVLVRTSKNDHATRLFAWVYILKKIQGQSSRVAHTQLPMWYLKCAYRQNFYLLSDSIYHPINFCKKISIWVKCNLFRSFKNVQIWSHFGPPFTPVFPWFGMSCDVN